MKCRKCGTENELDTVYCISCGNKLDKKSNDKTKEKKVKNTNNSKKNKLIILLPVIVVLLVIAIILVNIIKKNTNDSELATLFDSNLIKIKENEKYGYINSNGKVVINPKYDEATDFYGNYAVVEEKVNEDGKETNVYEIIDTKGNVKITTNYSSDIEYISKYNVWIINDQLYNSSLKKISSDNVEVDYEDDGYLSWVNNTNNTAGIMNTSGKVTYTYKFTGSEHYLGVDPSEVDDNLKDKYCRITIDNDKYAIVNCETGKVIYDYTDKYISNEDSNIFEISEHDTYKTLFVLYIQNDKIVYQSENGNIELKDYYIKNGYITIYDKKEYEDKGYIDIKVGKITDTKPSYSSSDSDNLSDWEEYTGLTKFSCTVGYGLMKNDKISLPCEWTTLDFFKLSLYEYLESKGKPYIMAKKDGKMYLINAKNGKTVEEFNTSSIYDYYDSTFIYYTDNTTSKVVVYNLITGKSLTFDKNTSVKAYPNYITVKQNNKLNYYNTDLKLIYTTGE